MFQQALGYLAIFKWPFNPMVSASADGDPGDTLARDATALMARMTRGINAPVRSQPPYLIAFDSLWPISDKR